MLNNNHTKILELLPIYALDCLDEEDTILVSEHLAVCSACHDELQAYQLVADQLALAAPDAAPPPDLKRQLMDRVQPLRLTALAKSGSRWWQVPVNFMQRIVPVWGLAGLVLILVLVVSNLWLWQRVNQLEATTRQEQMQTISLTGTNAAPSAQGLIVVSLDGEYGTLVVEGLSPLDSEHQYQLWLIWDGQRTSGAIFSVEESGYGSVWISSPESLSHYSAFGITIEPAGGSPGPTGDKVLGGSL